MLLKLPCNERARCALVCRRLAQLTRSSQRLWREMEVSDYNDDINAGPLAHIVPFLSSHPRGVQRLTLKLGWADTGPGEALGPTMATLAGATAFVASTLRCLEVELTDELTNVSFGWLGVWQWVAPLRHLRWLRLVWDGHELTRHLGTLTQLKGLDLSTNNSLYAKPTGSSLALEPGCIPPSLEHLWVRYAQLECWPFEFATAAGSLRQLNLHFVKFEPEDPTLDTRPPNLGLLTQLTRLALEAWPLGAALLSQLPSLPSLQALSLRGAEFEGPPAKAWAHQHLSALQGLTERDLGDLRLQHLPPGLSFLPSLQVLNLAANDLETPPGSVPAGGDSCPSCLPRLTALNADLSFVFQLLPILPGAGRLASLGLVYDSDYSTFDIVQLSAVLMLLPALEDLFPSVSYEQFHPDVARALKATCPPMLRSAMLARHDVTVHANTEHFPPSTFNKLELSWHALSRADLSD